MKMMKKVLALALAGAMALCVLTGCGGGGGGSSAVSTDDLVDALNGTGAAKFVVTEDVEVNEAAIEKVQQRVNYYLTKNNTLTRSVEFTMAESMEAELEDEGDWTDEVCAIVENSSRMTTKELAAQVVKNVERLELTQTAKGYHLENKDFSFEQGETYDVTVVTLNTNKGVCTVVLFD